MFALWPHACRACCHYDV